MQSIFNFRFKFHLVFLFHFNFSEKLRLLVCKVLGRNSSLFCKLNLLPQSLDQLQFAFQSSFLVFHRPLQATIKEQCDFPLSKNKKEKSSVAVDEATCCNATMCSNFVQPSGFQICAETALADFVCQNYRDQNPLPFRANSFQEGILFGIRKYSVRVAKMLQRLIVVQVPSNVQRYSVCVAEVFLRLIDG